MSSASATITCVKKGGGERFREDLCEDLGLAGETKLFCKQS
jgi:hypothetical protein